MHYLQFIVTPAQDMYTFGPLNAPKLTFSDPVITTAARPMHKSVKLLNRKSDAVSAKFRSMIHENIKIWFENNQGGSFQGSLSLGKEYTLNTYVDHVFFFTNDAKTKEYARFTMKADQVKKYFFERKEI